ncbi:alpha-glucosidase [Streptomyces purpurascens]
MGELEGVRTRLPYLRDLGVDAVWLSPFYASPQADAGYDVADYRAVDPMFGNLLDADALIRDAHELSLRHRRPGPEPLLDQHEWFKRAVARGPRLPAAGALPLPPARGRTASCPQRLGVDLRRPGVDTGTR